MKKTFLKNFISQTLRFTILTAPLVHLPIASAALSKSEAAQNRGVDTLKNKNLENFLELLGNTANKTAAGFGITEQLKLSEQEDSLLGSLGTQYQVYHVDINNDGEEEYVITFINGGSMKTSGVYGVLKNKRGVFVNIRFDKFKLHKHFMHLGKPFLTKSEKSENAIVINFLKDKSVKSYIWKGKKMRPVSKR